MKNKQSVLWAPDIIRESNGVACGDMLAISAYREDNCLFFSYSGNACSVALKVASYLEEILSGELETEIKAELERLKNGQYYDSEKWISEYQKNRKYCVESPINLLTGIIEDNKIVDVDIREKAILACDACVSTKEFYWRPKTKKNQSVNLEKIEEDIKKLDNDKEIQFQKLGLCVLSQEQQKEFERVLKNVTDSELKLIKKLRLSALLLNNSYKYNLKIDKKIEGLAVKQRVSLAVANVEIRNINKYIKDNNLKIDSVKGEKTNKYYPKGHIRTHMDFDYLATNFDDAFKLISYLINSRKFKFVNGGSVPFSLKNVMNSEGKEVLTGHIHLEKILQNNYQVVVDVNIGGFPLGRTSIIQCNFDGKIEIEDLVCITVAHIFKHEHVFIKDINDLYYLLDSDYINEKKLMDKIETYRLKNLFAIVYKFLKNAMGLNIKLDVKEECESLVANQKKWPFSRRSHFYIKAKDMLIINQKQYGEKKGKRETIKQICGNSSEIEAEKYRKLNKNMNERVYLYPIAIFNNVISDLKQKQFEVIDTNIMKYKQVLILPVGLFLIQNDLESEIKRENLNDIIKFILETLMLNENNCNMFYMMEPRKDTWLY